MSKKKTIDNVATIEFDSKGNPVYKFDKKRLSKEIEKTIETLILKNIKNVKKV